MKNTDSSCEEPRFLIQMTKEQLDILPWAVVKLDRGGVFTYGNRKMCEIAGVENIEGRSIAEVFDEENLALVRHHLNSRFTQGIADEYQVELVRPNDGLRVPIRCSAMPEISEDGNVVGAIAIVNDLLMADISQVLHAQMERLHNSRDILKGLAEECQRALSFDLFGVSLYSLDGDHTRAFYRYPEGDEPINRRWWQLTDFGKKIAAEKKSHNIADFKAWLSQTEWEQFRDEPDIRQFLDRGFRSSLWYPIVREDRLVAYLFFFRKEGKKPFSKQDEDRLAQLPLEAAVGMALHCEKIGNLEFSLKLISKIAATSEGTERIAEILVREIAKHYQWENVSIFRPDEEDGVIRLVTQQAEKQSFLLPENWQHPIDKGITGHVLQTRKPLNIPDLGDKKYKDLHIAGYHEAQSELCIPIMVGGRVYWFLNVEDSKKNAFAREEEDEIENILHEVAAVLERAVQHQIYTELLKRSRDAVIETDFQGIIKQANPAAEELLGRSEAEMKGISFQSYFKNQDLARRVQEAATVPNDETRFLHKDGTEVSVLLSGTSLPREIGLKVYIASDLSTRKRIETVEILRHMYNEIASQIKTPLSLAFTWIGKLQKAVTEPEAEEILAKTVKQLHKVDLSFDRLLFYERNQTLIPLQKVLFDFPHLLEKVMQDFPDSEAERIKVRIEPALPPVQGDLYQISFSVESILAYLVRFLPEEGSIQVNIGLQNGEVGIAINGYAPEVTGGAVTDYAESRWAIRAITELAVGEEMIRSFVENNHGGKFHKQRRDEGRIEYTIALPAALQEVPNE